MKRAIYTLSTYALLCGVICLVGCDLGHKKEKEAPKQESPANHSKGAPQG